MLIYFNINKTIDKYLIKELGPYIGGDVLFYPIISNKHFLFSDH
jgi:hypothetical protein